MEQEILQLENRWVAALLAGDAETLAAMYADDIVYIHTNAAVDSKASYLAHIRSGNLTYQSLNRDDITVRLFGTTALVACHWQARSISNGIHYEINARYLHVYAKHGDEWRMVAHQSTRLP